MTKSGWLDASLGPQGNQHHRLSGHHPDMLSASQDQAWNNHNPKLKNAQRVPDKILVNNRSNRANSQS